MLISCMMASVYAAENPQNKVIEVGSAELVRVVLPKKPNDHLERIVSVFARQVEKRCPARVTTQGEAPLTVALTVDPAIGKEEFRIRDRAGGGIEVVGQNRLGVLYGLGKLLRTSRYSEDGFAPGSWRGESVPQKPIRGIYFATHFHNYYHDAPVEEIERYVEELALWGFNTLLIWYDMHHFDGFDDPKAVAFRERLYAIGKAAQGIGLEIGLINIANEAYNNSPDELRVGANVGRGGWYDCTVCPEKSGQDGRGGLEYILTILGEVYDWIAALRPKYVVIWPYDPGGCGCEKCRPWGSNGFVRTGAKVAALARKKLPSVKIIASTWYLNRDEWAGMAKALKEEKSWADIILAEGHTWKLDGLPMVGFPEISMHGMFPWGGFGASILAAHVEGQWNRFKAASAGGFPYSEGIFEDVSKVVYSQLFWSNRARAETLKEYIAYEYSPEHVDALHKVMVTLEENHHFRWWPGQMEGAHIPGHWIPHRGTKPQADPGAEEAWATVQQVEKDLPQWARSSWRWRILYLRALLDAELKANGGKPNARCNEAFEELIRIFHAERANPVLRPPVPYKKVIEVGNAELAVVLGAKASPVEKRVTALLAERINDRTGITLAESGGKAAFRLVIGTVASNDKIKAFSANRKDIASLGTDGYCIAVDTQKPELYVVGQSNSGVVAGVGRLMCQMRYQQGKLEVPALHISETPQMPNRGMYLWARKHFFGKPDQVDRYIEEFALWGCNALTFWFEMGMFKSFDDPDAKHWLAMYRRFYETARRMGMKTGLLMVVNDAYKTSPEKLRISPIVGCPNHYMCPSKPGSVKKMIAWQEQVFKALAPIDIYNLFPADPGGCSCKDCTQWPTRGFWRIAKPLGDRIHEISPKTEIWVDTWHLNHKTFGGKDWKDLVANLDWTKERPQWFAGFEVGLAPKHGYAHMSAEDRKYYNEAKVPLMVFPDISMWGNHPGMLVNKEYWKSLQAELNDYSAKLMKGGWPYSERWNTDIANVMFISWFWNSKKTVETVLDEYASFYFGPEAETGRELLDLLDNGYREPKRKQKIRQTLAKLESSVPEWVKRDWRWHETVESCRFKCR